MKRFSFDSQFNTLIIPCTARILSGFRALNRECGEEIFQFFRIHTQIKWIAGRCIRSRYVSCQCRCWFGWCIDCGFGIWWCYRRSHHHYLFRFRQVFFSWTNSCTIISIWMSINCRLKWNAIIIIFHCEYTLTFGTCWACCWCTVVILFCVVLLNLALLKYKRRIAVADDVVVVVAVIVVVIAFGTTSESELYEWPDAVNGCRFVVVWSIIVPRIVADPLLLLVAMVILAAADVLRNGMITDFIS